MILASQNRSLKSTQPNDRCEPIVSVPANEGWPAEPGGDAGVLPAIDGILGDLARAVNQTRGELSGKDACNMTYKSATKRDRADNFDRARALATKCCRSTIYRIFVLQTDGRRARALLKRASV